MGEVYWGRSTIHSRKETDGSEGGQKGEWKSPWPSLRTWAQGLLVAGKRSSLTLIQRRKRVSCYMYSGASPRTQLHDQPGLITHGNSPLPSDPQGGLFPQVPRHLPNSPPPRWLFPCQACSVPAFLACPCLWLALAPIPDLTTLAPPSSLT